MKGFTSLIGNYPSDSIIELFARLSVEMHNKPFTKDGINNHLRFYNTTLWTWDISSIQYMSIKHSNDYQGKKITGKDDKEIAKIINNYYLYKNEHSGAEKIKDVDANTINKFLFALKYEQDLYNDSTLSWIYQGFNRNYHILKGTKLINNKINIDDIVHKKFGFFADDLIAIYFIIIFYLCKQNPDILNAPEELYRKKNNTILTRENIKKVVDYYTISYNDVRESQFKHLIFCSKPFVKTQKGTTLMTNFYLVERLISDGLYWLVRDYYYSDNRQDFVNDFGNMFESYFHELLSTYLSKEQYEKIKESNNKSVDYILFFERSTILVELKSALIPLESKQQNPILEKFDAFFKNNIEKACKQLQVSEKELNNGKPFIKFILLYENILNTVLIQATVPDIAGLNKNTYIITISDVENFLVFRIAEL